MKKLFTILVALALSSVAFAEWPQSVDADFPSEGYQGDNLNKKIHTATALVAKVAAAVSPASKDAHNKSVFRIEMKVRSRFESQSQENDNIVTKDCAAVRIDKNWLIASLTCRGTKDVATAYDKYGNGYAKTVEFRKIDSLKVLGHSVAKEDIFEDPVSKTILIRISSHNADLVNDLNDKSSVSPRLLVADNPVALLASIKKAYINRENYCLPGRCSAEVDVEQYCTDKGCYQVEWKWINGDAGDPLFMLSSKHGDAEFLAGLNSEEIDGTNVGSGRYYRAFSKETKDFITKVIGRQDKQAYARIKAGLIDEKKF